MAQSHGPLDALVIISVVDVSGNQIQIDEDVESFILDAVSKCGETLLVRSGKMSFPRFFIAFFLKP